MIRLIKPTPKYKKSFAAANREFKKDKRSGYIINTLDSGDGFPEFLKKMRDYEKGNNLPKGYVPATYYWLMDGSEFIGETTIRHKLTPLLLKRGGHIGYGIRPSKRKQGYGKKILALALKKAKKFGIKKALVTCDDKNIASAKIIEANRGILENKIRVKGELVRRYWIRIK